MHEGELAPIVLFVYNRPSHTRQCLEALMKNDLASQSILYIYSDGPKNNFDHQQLSKINDVRKLIRENKWCSKVEIIERQFNFGLANSITQGVGDVLSKHQNVIVLEDDIVPSPVFLRFMNDALLFYKNNEQVMCISGYMYPVKQNLPSTFFIKIDSCWGWGTWRRAWVNFITDATFLQNSIVAKNNRNDFNFDGSYDFFSMLVQCSLNQIDSWSIKWYASIFLADGLTLFPSLSYVKNIGNDGSGIHSGVSNNFEIPMLNTSTQYHFNTTIEENAPARKSLRKYFKNLNKSSFFNQVKLRLYAFINN